MDTKEGITPSRVHDQVEKDERPAVGVITQADVTPFGPSEQLRDIVRKIVSQHHSSYSSNQNDTKVGDVICEHVALILEFLPSQESRTASLNEKDVEKIVHDYFVNCSDGEKLGLPENAQKELAEMQMLITLVTAGFEKPEFILDHRHVVEQTPGIYSDYTNRDVRDSRNQGEKAVKVSAGLLAAIARAYQFLFVEMRNAEPGDSAIYAVTGYLMAFNDIKNLLNKDRLSAEEQNEKRMITTNFNRFWRNLYHAMEENGGRLHEIDIAHVAINYLASKVNRNASFSFREAVLRFREAYQQQKGQGK